MLRAVMLLAAVCCVPVGAQTVPKIESLTANQGLYGNRIPDRTFPNPFTEVCIFASGVLSDQNEAGDSTQGGNCRPGFTGWVIERSERTADNWDDARMACTMDGMRLPESFEWLYSCSRADAFGLDDMTGDYEWAGNAVIPMTNAINGTFATAIAVYGNASCRDGNWFGFANAGNFGILTYRCVR